MTTNYWKRPDTLEEAQSLMMNIRTELLGHRQNLVEREAVIRMADTIMLLVDEWVDFKHKDKKLAEL